MPAQLAPEYDSKRNEFENYLLVAIKEKYLRKP